jgi:hypothetical protein
MKKKILSICLLHALAFSVALCAACSPIDVSGSSDNGSSEKTEISVPEGEEVIPFPDGVPMPEQPVLPDIDILSTPYIGRVGTTTEAYSVSEIKTEGKLTGAEIVYPAEGKNLSDYHFIYFDIYNYTAEYPNIRFDFSGIDGAEKIAVAAVYMEAYDGEGIPPVGVLSESLMDGEMSLVTHLNDYKVIDKNYVEGKDVVADMQVARLLVYLDSNPSQAPSDKAGRLTIDAITFLSDEDPRNDVDNSPKIGEISGSSGYTLTDGSAAGYDKVFKAEYKTAELLSGGYISAKINRFVGAYGRISLEWAADGCEKLTVTDGENVLFGLDDSGNAVKLENIDPKRIQKIVVDIRGASALNELRFYVDSQSGVTSDETERAFELLAANFLYTPYASDSWSATSKFTLSGGALGGKVKASYDKDVGWDFLSVKVKYWTPAYNALVAKFKLSGAGGGAERFGLSINSNKVILQVEDNLISDLDYDEKTGEYTLVADLSEVGRLNTLNFFFDSINVTSFEGIRTVEFTSIEFSALEKTLKIKNMQPTPGYTVERTGEETHVSWTADREGFYTVLPVKNWTSESKYFTVTVKNDGNAPFTLALYIGWNVCWYDHTEIAAGETKNIVVEAKPDAADFEINFFWDYGQKRAGSAIVTETGFVSEPVGVETTIGDIRNFETNTSYLIDKTQEGTNVSWDETRPQWDYAQVDVSYYNPGYTYLKVVVFTEDNVKFGVYYGGTALLGHTALTAGENVFWIFMPENMDLNFTLNLYFNGGMQSSGGVIVRSMEFFEEKEEPQPTELTIGDLKDINNEGYTINGNAADGFHVIWGEDRSIWAKATASVINYTDNYKYVKLTFTSAVASKVGLYVNDVAWKGHTAIKTGTDEWYIAVPAGTESAFVLTFYFDGGLTTAGDLNMKIEFLEELPELPQSIGKMIATKGYTVTEKENGYNVKWVENRSDYIYVNVENWKTENNYLTFTVTNNATENMKLGLYSGGYSNCLMSHTVIGAGETKHFVVKLTTVTSANFDIRFFIDYGVKQAGDIDIAEITLISEEPQPTELTVGELTDINNEGYTINGNAADGFHVIWGEDRSIWAKATASVSNYTDNYKYVKLTFTSAVASKVGLYVNDVAWKGHTAIKTGTDEWYIAVPAGMESAFVLTFYFDGGLTTAGDLIMKIEFATEMPQTISAMNATNGYTVTEVDSGYNVKWAETRSDYVYVNVDGWNTQNKYLVFTVTNNGTESMKLGLYTGGYSNCLMAHTAIGAGETKQFAVELATVTSGSFDIRFFIDFGIKSTGDINIVGINLISEAPPAA